VSSANILHGSATSIGGQTRVIKLRWGQPAAKLPFEGAVPGIKFALGENPKRSNFSIPGQPRRYPATRMGVAETIRGAFSEARDYKKTWDDYHKRVAARSEEHTSELQSPDHLVCRLLLEKKKKKQKDNSSATSN